jgi:hypothetical protein
VLMPLRIKGDHNLKFFGDKCHVKLRKNSFSSPGQEWFEFPPTCGLLILYFSSRGSFVLMLAHICRKAALDFVARLASCRAGPPAKHLCSRFESWRSWLGASCVQFGAVATLGSWRL